MPKVGYPGHLMSSSPAVPLPGDPPKAHQVSPLKRPRFPAVLFYSLHQILFEVQRHCQVKVRFLEGDSQAGASCARCLLNLNVF